MKKTRRAAVRARAINQPAETLIQAGSASATTGLFTVWSAVIVTVLDFAAPHLGGFRTGTDPYVWTIESFGPPPP